MPQKHRIPASDNTGSELFMPIALNRFSAHPLPGQGHRLTFPSRRRLPGSRSEAIADAKIELLEKGRTLHR